MSNDWREALRERYVDVLLERLRVLDRDSETAAGWPTSHSMIVQLRNALDLFTGAMPISPQRVWQDALDEVRRLRDGAGG